MGFTFKLDDLPTSTSSDPIPAGWYTAKITEAEEKDTKAGDGQYIKLRFDITGPSHEGRVVFTNLNHQNKNSKAVEIALSHLRQIMVAGGLREVTHSDQLIGLDIAIKVSIRKSAEYGDQNDIKEYKPVGSAPASSSASSQASTPSKAKMPWEK